MLSSLKTKSRARMAAWREQFANGITSEATRKAAWWDLQLYDHGFLRRFWTNLNEIAPNVWRSNQPSPRQLETLASDGIKTIINLRGASQWGSYHLEADACARLGLTLVDFRLRSRDLPTVEEVHALHELFKTAEHPILMHCKSGADRAGMGAALYKLLMLDATPEAALDQLSFRYLHVKAAKTGLLDHMLEAYAKDHESTGKPFLDWLESDYDRLALTAEFKPKGLANLLTDTILRRE